MSLLKTEILSPPLWDGDMKIQLPHMQEGALLYLHFVMPSKSRVEGIFVVEKRLDMYDTREGGYVQRLRLRPFDEGKEGDKEKVLPFPGGGPETNT